MTIAEMLNNNLIDASDLKGKKARLVKQEGIRKVGTIGILGIVDYNSELGMAETYIRFYNKQGKLNRSNFYISLTSLELIAE